MIKITVIDKIKFLSISVLILLLSFIIRVNMLIPLLLITLTVYFKFRKLDSLNCDLMRLGLLFLVSFALTDFITQQKWPALFIPLCTIPILATILFNTLEISLLFSVATSISVAFINVYLGILFLISAIAASLLIFGARRRIDIIRAGFIIGLVQVLLLLLTRRFAFTDSWQYLTMLLNGIVCGIIVLGVLPVFEYLFAIVTNISLLELADFNHPLLQKMILEAPGTYHHSLIVGNLSEAACTAVGANALLARIGAYYHDIGKIEKPGYFSENQNLELNKHDVLSPTISKMVIINHVKDGVELAKKYKLNARLIDFIQQHHGNSLVYYFYRRALENLEEDQAILEEGFRYPGPKPSSKETAIVLLADSVEAATRAMREPNPAKIEELVHKIINNKFIDGQLDECELTLKDLEKISAVFIRILGGIYHSRVSYPEQKDKK